MELKFVGVGLLLLVDVLEDLVADDDDIYWH